MKKKPTTKQYHQAKALRLRVFEVMGNSEIDGHILVSNMEMVCDWITNGKAPRKEEKFKPKLAASGI